MDVATVARLGMKHARSAVSEALYLRAGRDLTRPTAIHAVLTMRCNCRCKYCEFWRLDKEKYGDEMSIEEWKTALLGIRTFIGTYNVEFTGGEPLVKKGALDLFRFCGEHGIRFGITTNALLIDAEMARTLVALRPFNINISVDSTEAGIHDELRGVPGALETVRAGIDHLVREREAQGASFAIIVKPTVSVKNFRGLPDVVRWAQAAGATSINFQPLDRWTPETYEELWVEEADLPALQEVAETLIRMKAEGAPILNTEMVLRLWPNHFREESAPPEAMPCRVGMRNCFIQPNGDLQVCWQFPPLGNLREQTAREIWYSEKGRKVRKATVACEELCLFTCLSQKTLGDKVRMALQLLKGSRARKKDGTASS